MPIRGGQNAQIKFGWTFPGKPPRKHPRVLALELRRVDKFITKCEKRLDDISFAVLESPFDSELTADGFLLKCERTLKKNYRPFPSLSTVRQGGPLSKAAAATTDGFMLEVIKIQKEVADHIYQMIKKLRADRCPANEAIHKLREVVDETIAELRRELGPILQYRADLIQKLNAAVTKKKSPANGGASDRNKTGKGDYAADSLLTLEQMATLVSVSKSTLEKQIPKDGPPPAQKSRGSRPALYKFTDAVPWLKKHYPQFRWP